ncbi:MAG: IPTL-CTERM sorting domain-containing protein [Candidatus Kapabacteria bacterium]|nr:IPTL-CTERM sorting domain-containing protein [Ignavibacteriota bacterium]MCW5883742.1 IPTL-CTERM sorting domain-containing protein [Candidatus Kapabacteria bacterium]
MKKYLILIIIILASAAVLKSDMGLFDGVLTTTPVFNINLDNATSGGYVELTNDDLDVTQKGIVWSTSTEPTLSSNTGFTQEGAGPNSGASANFTSEMSSLVNGTTYYVRAYITNGDGTFYGNEVSFVSVPTLGEWGMIALATLLAGFGGWFVWRRVV